MCAWTEDRFFNGAISVRQERNGYRFSIDAIIAAAGVVAKAGQTVVDLGTGCGIIPLILACRYADIRIVGVEIQKDLAELAIYNRDRNHFKDQFDVINTDMRTLGQDQLSGQVDWVVCNPPYRRSHSGRLNPVVQRALARHEININLFQLIQTANRILRSGGRLVIIYPAERLVELVTTMCSLGIQPKWLQLIFSRAGESAKLVLVRGVKGARPGLVIDPPLEIYNPDGSYSTKVDAMMKP